MNLPPDVVLFCGGPSPERGISLNSARCVFDHLSGDGIGVHPVYVDLEKRMYLLEPRQLYSNTPADFDFKLGAVSRSRLTESGLAKLLRGRIAFPAIHGAFGEDGGVQSLLEGMGVPFVGSDRRETAL